MLDMYKEGEGVVLLGDQDAGMASGVLELLLEV